MCIFCSIVKGEIPATRIYEDDTVLAILDISQVTKGHTLVILKQHTENFMSCEPELMKHVMEVAQMLAKRIMERTHAEGMNVLSNIHEVAGQSVMHFHVHLIPRYSEQDACVIRFDKSDPQDLDAIGTLLK